MTDLPPPSPARAAPSVPDLLVALGVLLLGGLLLWGTLQIPFGINAVIGPRAFPFIVSVGLLGLGAALLAAVLRGHRAEPAAEEDTDPDAPVDLRQPALILGGFVLGALVLQPLGFVLGTALMYVSVGAAFGERRWPLLVGVGLAVALVTYVVFTRGLGLTLPPGVLRGVL
ncbi:tripartite tricarboxylate transporter TctB family protein [Deinococcus sp. HMF7620]|uniref:Tripartite tricarboxylate transporter TctB family protein n=1 Tax=Deinococcus arboris TaxID=2682977 RepID=A0A7C9M4S9_9DEIO|nr:tripartite tricarboxylate transporter TctB family protein [Deinococcus arboris]MVN85985.1 tripartite tricarboxylate transporter TctB family protein [Deinococcus arboris]